jgi:hypothetical protein
VAGTILLPCALFVGALAVRLPHLMDVPGITDEAIDVKVALEILDGRWVLVDAEPYIGALFNYLMAAGFALLGREPYVPRLLVTVLGALTVVLTYLLGRRLGGTATGVLAAGFLATSGVQIANSHIAWSNCITPFFATASMLALVEATRRTSGPLLVVAGLLFGLAVQTHASVALLAPALVAHLLIAPSVTTPTDTLGESISLRRTLQRWLRTPWPYLALLAAVLAVSNVIAFNLLNPGAWDVAVREKEYAYVESPDLGTYVTNLGALLAALLRMSASSFDGDTTLSAQLSIPANWPYALALVVGAGYAAWKRHVLLLLGIGIAALALPYMNRNYDFPTGVRYLGYVVPLLAVLIALPIGHAAQAWWRRARPRAALPCVVGLALIILPTGRLASYYETYLRLGATTPTVLAIQEAIQVEHRAGYVTEVLLDPQLEWIYTAPGGRVSKSFDLVFAIVEVPRRTVWMVPPQVQTETRGATGPVVLIVSAASRERLGNGFTLVPLDVPERPYLRRDQYWAYRYVPPHLTNSTGSALGR